MDSRRSENSRKDLTKIKVAIIKKNYPEVKLTWNEQDLILKELGRIFQRILNRKLPNMRSSRVERHVCADQWSGQWLITAIDN